MIARVERMQTRATSTTGAAQMKVSAKLTSPYATREVSTAMKLTSVEKKNYFWLLTSHGLNA